MGLALRQCKEWIKIISSLCESVEVASAIENSMTMFQEVLSMAQMNMDEAHDHTGTCRPVIEVCVRL